MPRVPAEHLAERRRQILHAAMTLFAENGFHATSMQQIIAASGMSAGAVYHYFPTKKSLVEATGQAVQAAYGSPLAALPTDPLPTPREVIQALTTAMADIHEGDIDFTRIGIFMWAEGLRDPEARAGLRAVQLGLRRSLLPWVHRWQAAGMITPDVEPEDAAAAIYGLIPGYTLQLNILGDISASGYAAGATSFRDGA